MSQEKVERYKEEKANRKATLKKQKTMKMVRRVLLSIITVLLIGWLGYSAYGVYEDKQPREVVEVDYAAVDGYLQTVRTANE